MDLQAVWAERGDYHSHFCVEEPEGLEVSSGGGTAYPRENWGWGHACLALASGRCVLLSFAETSGAHPLVRGCFPR